MTSVRDRDDRTEVRVVAQTPTATTALVGACGVGGARRADLLGRLGNPLTTDGDGVVRLPMPAGRIAIVQLGLN
ncbi:hypothetical protein [Micromonospora sp. NPDC047730]|uniref:hypothetical protein n=1 Tax=Micromonospora sp. NPDC047730 TaxID=3364253 RepID=UPI00371269CA